MAATCVTEFLREQLVACLRESFPTPLATRELIDLMPDEMAGSVYRNLRALEKYSVLGRVHLPGYSCVFWCYLPDTQVAEEIDALERLWLA